MTDDLRLRKSTSPERGGQDACLNCGNPLDGPFCSACGQRDIPPYPSTRELAEEAISEFSGWDGRLGSTLRTLIAKPGLLTLEFLEGRRVRYISPLRLYLSASLVYFVLAASSPEITLGSDKSLGGVQINTTTTSVPDARVHDPRAETSGKGVQITPEERAQALAGVKDAPWFVRGLLVRAITDPGAFKRAILENMPRVLFALLPVFAGIIALFYRHRKYPEHLYFAIHLYAFIFLALALAELSKFTRIPLFAAAVTSLVLIAIPVYATVAFRRVYAGSWAGTIAREIAIALIYGVAASAAFLAMVFLIAAVGA